MSSTSSVTETAAPRLQHLTPVLIVDRVEPCLQFWVERFGFADANRVPAADGSLAFGSVEKDGVELMYATKASVLAQSPEQARELEGHSVTLFITVANLDDVERVLADAPVVVPRHETSYGSSEVYVKEPGGHTVGFAQMR